MQDTLTSTTAAHWNNYQLAAILTSCFEGYLTPFTIQGDAFTARFAAEDVSLNDSMVWLKEGKPVALALIARRGQTSDLPLLLFALLCVGRDSVNAVFSN